LVEVDWGGGLSGWCESGRGGECGGWGGGETVEGVEGLEELDGGVDGMVDRICDGQ